MPGTLVHSPADALSVLLIDLGYGVSPPVGGGGTWPIFVASEPDMPDNCITIYDTAGVKHGRTQTDGETQEHHGIMVRIRSVNFPTGYTKARALAVALDTQCANRTVSISNTHYIVKAVSRSGDVLYLGKETPDSKRTLFTVNALVGIRQV